MEQQTRLNTVEEKVRQAALQAVGGDRQRAPSIEHFLRTSEETWEGAGSGRFSLAQIKEAGVYSDQAKAALRWLFDQMAELLPADAKAIPTVRAAAIRQRASPMVRGVVQPDWRDAALRELGERTFVLNFQGARAALEAELSTSWIGEAWRVLWILFEDYDLKPAAIEVGCDGMSGGEFAHVRWSSYHSNDPFSDVVVHEAAHLLHYLKPESFGLQVRRGQERFVDVAFAHRELFAYSCEAYSRAILKGSRQSRITFAAKMREHASSFPAHCRDKVADLVLAGAQSRNGWRVIRDTTVTPPDRKRMVSGS